MRQGKYSGMYGGTLREIASIMAGPGNDDTRDLLIQRACCEGLSLAATRLRPVLSGQEQAEVASRLAAVRAALARAAAGVAQERLDVLLTRMSSDDEPPF